jgi:Holliday junction resolvasome RuvABC ATP-dependent DNA helicase subunit
MQENLRATMQTFVKQVQPKFLFHVASPEQIRADLSRSNPENPFHNLVGQDDVINKVLRLAFAALSREDHNASDIRLAFLGPAGTGKTTVANKLADLLDLPFANINPGMIKTTHDLFVEIAKAAAGVGFEHDDGRITTLALRPQQDEFHYQSPPMVVFIDEVHLLNSQIEQGLLTATDGGVHELVTPQGYRLDTQNICWIIATTESGRIFHALKTRFSKAQFRNYTTQEVAGIVRANTGLPTEVCERAAFFAGRVTRQAIDFAREVALEKDMSGGTWAEAIEVIRREHGIDRFGMEVRRVEILSALSRLGTMSQARLQVVARVQAEEFKDEIMAPLLDFIDEGEPMVMISSKGYRITAAGLAELAKRGIKPVEVAA